MAGNQYNATLTTRDGQKIIAADVIIFDSATAQPSSNTNAVTSGTLPQMAVWVSGTAQQNPVSYPITVVLSPTGDATNNVATVAVALSPDNTTFTTVSTWSLAAAVNNTGAITTTVAVPVPTSWYIKVTLVHSTVAQSSYY